MSYTNAELKTKFLTRFDDYSGYFSDSRISDIFNEALLRILDKKYQIFQQDNKVTEELSQLVVPFVGAPTTTSSHTKPADWKYLLDLKLKYTINGQTIYRKAKLYRENSAEDAFETATEKHPTVRILGTTLSFDPAGVTEITLTYLKEPTAIDVAGSPSAVTPIPSKLQNVVVDEAILIASSALRDAGMYQLQSNEVNSNP